MLKDEIAVIGAGLAGETVGIEFQRRNYLTYLINGSVQDNKSLPDAKNLLVLEGYDGLSGERSLAYEALKRNRRILKKIAEIPDKRFYIIQSLSMANWLCSQGHKILKVEDNTKNPDFKVFLFDDTAMLHKAMALFKRAAN